MESKSVIIKNQFCIVCSEMKQSTGSQDTGSAKDSNQGCSYFEAMGHFYNLN
jgi:hypothetical protein